MTKEDLIKKWLSGELSDSEKKEFESSKEFAEINKLIEAVQNFKAPEYNVAKEFSKLSKNTLFKKETISLYERISPILKIAAIFIAVLTISYFSYNYFKSTTVNSKWVADQEVYLPDSSYVRINAGSKIRFIEKEWKNERNVELNGEAFFSVKKGSKFNVKTLHGTVNVLGTEFSVKDRENYYEVTCYSGLVKVITKQSSVLLKPKSVFRTINGNKESFTIPKKSEPDWLNGESSFKSVPFTFVLNEFERQYQVSVETNNVDLNQLFTGGFSHNNLELALKSITIPVNLHYEIDGNKIVISFESK